MAQVENPLDANDPMKGSLKIEENIGKVNDKPQRSSKRKIRQGNSRGRRRLVFHYSLGRKPVNLERRKRVFPATNQRNDRKTRERPRRKGIRLLIRNLTKNVTNAELKELFQRAGPLKRCGINYNEVGDTKGTADIEYFSENDAFKAHAKFNNKSIHGVPIRIEIKGRRKNQFVVGYFWQGPTLFG